MIPQYQVWGSPLSQLTHQSTTYSMIPQYQVRFSPLSQLTQQSTTYQYGSLMATLVATCFPEKAPELYTYQASIVQAERNFKDQQWVRCYRQETLATKNLEQKPGQSLTSTFTMKCSLGTLGPYQVAHSATIPVRRALATLAVHGSDGTVSQLSTLSTH